MINFSEIHDNGFALSKSPVNIKVIGVGGGGSNAVHRMIEVGVQGLEFIVANTDLQALHHSSASIKVGIGENLTNGMGAGGNPEIGEKAAIEDSESIKSALEGANMVFVTACMGGGTGTGGAPVIAQIAKECGALTIGVVTKPFDFERAVRMHVAEAGIAKLREQVDALVVIPNDNLFKVTDKNVTVIDAYARSNDVLCLGVQKISELITRHGIQNIDFADLKTTIQGKGDLILGVGMGRGEHRAIEAATSAINNPLLEDSNIEGAKNILVYIVGGESLSLEETKEIVGTISQTADPDVNLIYGYTMDSSLDDELSVTVVATGMSKEKDSELSFLNSQTPIKDKEQGDDNLVSYRQWEEIGKKSLYEDESSDTGVSNIAEINAEKTTKKTETKTPDLFDFDLSDSLEYPPILRKNRISLDDK